MAKRPDHIRVTDRAVEVFCGGCGGGPAAPLMSITKRTAKARQNFAGVCKRCVHCMKAKEA